MQSIINATYYLHICSLTANTRIQSFYLINARAETLGKESLLIEYLWEDQYGIFVDFDKVIVKSIVENDWGEEYEINSYNFGVDWTISRQTFCFFLLFLRLF